MLNSVKMYILFNWSSTFFFLSMDCSFGCTLLIKCSRSWALTHTHTHTHTYTRHEDTTSFFLPPLFSSHSFFLLLFCCCCCSDSTQQSPFFEHPNSLVFAYSFVTSSTTVNRWTPINTILYELIHTIWVYVCVCMGMSNICVCVTA